MKTTRKPEGLEPNYSFEYSNWPSEGTKTAKIIEWENGEGYDVYLGEDKIELTNQELAVINILFANVHLVQR